MGKVCVFLADGFEEIEGLTVVDLLRRAGVETEMVSVNGKQTVCGSHQIEVKADVMFEDADFTDARILVLPGGMPGTTHLGEHAGLTALLQEVNVKEGGIAAICAAPTVLGDLGLVSGKKAVCYPGLEARLKGADVQMCSVVTDGHITTSRGMGTAIDFGLELVSRLCGQEKADDLARAIVYRS